MGQFQRKPILATNKNTAENEIVRFEVLTATLMKALVFCDVTLYFVGSCSSQNIGTSRPVLQSHPEDWSL
jgi:hypothetical protein